MSTLLWFVAGLLFISFLLIVVRGAPFVPTRRQDVEKLFLLYSFTSHDTFVDLGSGDGRILAAAAERGIRAVGFELNPFLVVYSRYMLRRYGQRAEVRLEDFWRAQLPETTAVVFVFLAGPFMKKLDTKLQQEAERLGHDLTLISYGMEIPGRTGRTEAGYHVYRYQA